ncbi:MAG: hypothetical protein IKB82_01740 [Clostridia bacterium]|nr:hypothetical protein [Clostridia bacterium]
MNTMMAGAGEAARKKNAYAGYAKEAADRSEEYDLYIAREAAGSSQDNLRDLNKRGYRTDRPWNDTDDTPTPLFETPVYKAAPKTGKKQKKKTFTQWLIHHAKRDKTGVAICAGLCCAMLMMVAVWGGEMVEGVRLADRIAQYESGTEAINIENDSLTQELERARSGERIRNLAQNQLGMLRPERAAHEVIYIRTAEHSANEVQLTEGETRLEFLDLMLGLLDMFHIGE